MEINKLLLTVTTGCVYFTCDLNSVGTLFIRYNEDICLIFNHNGEVDWTAARFAVA